MAMHNATNCWRCDTQLGDALHWTNGLDLDLDCAVQEATGIVTSNVPLAHRQEWRTLLSRWGKLTVLEEALVSRIAACTSVLKLPCDGQLGYKSSVINYINDTADVVQKLPRAPKDSQIVVFKVPGAEGVLTLQRVRKYAVREYLQFFSDYHPFYRDGIVDPSDPSRYLVKPFVMARDFDYDEWSSWADEFVAELSVLEAATPEDNGMLQLQAPSPIPRAQPSMMMR